MNKWRVTLCPRCASVGQTSWAVWPGTNREYPWGCYDTWAEAMDRANQRGVS